MGKPNVLILNPDMTFKEKRHKTSEDRIHIKREWNPQFSPGKSVFSEVGIRRWRFWRRARKLIVLADGSLQAFELQINNPGENELKPHYWDLKEIRKFVAKVLAKSKAQQRSISNTQLIMILAGLGIIGFLLLIVVKNTGGLRF